jgi:hypothetical protein
MFSRYLRTMTILTTTLLMLLWLGAGQASAWTVTVKNPTYKPV